MSASDTQINIPLGRLAWMLTFTMMPASLAGLKFDPVATLVIFILCVVVGLSMTALAIGDYKMKHGSAQNNSNALWLVFLGLPALAAVEGMGYGRLDWFGLAVVSAGFVTLCTLLLAWVNLEGVSLVLLAVNALNAAGTAWGLSNDGRLAVGFGVASLVLGVGVSILRGFFRSRTDARR